MNTQIAPRKAPSPDSGVTTIQPKSVLIDMASRFGMEPAAFEATVRATCMRPDTRGNVPSREEFAAFLLVAKEYRLNPLTKEIYAFTQKGGGIVPIVSLDGWANLINSHPQMDGMDFEMHHDDNGNLFACTCTIYRKDRAHPIAVTEYLSECIRNTEPWKMVHRMLRHKTLIQCARYAFGFSGIYDEDEGEKIAGPMKDVTPAARATRVAPKPPALHAPSPAERAKTDQVERRTVDNEKAQEPHDRTTGELLDDDEGQAEPEEATASEPDNQEAGEDAGTDEPEPEFDFDGLEAALGAETTLEGIEERWMEFDCDAVLEGQEMNHSIALAVKNRAIKRVKKAMEANGEKAD